MDAAIQRLDQYISALPHSQFSTTLSAINRKFGPVMRACRRNQHDFYFWICDYIAAFEHAVELFGPVPKPQFIRNPAQYSWVLIFFEPILLFPAEYEEMNAAQISMYTETCVILTSIIAQFKKQRCIYKDLIEGLWDLLIENSPLVNGIVEIYTNNLLITILNKQPVCSDIIHKVVLLRATTMEYSSLRFTTFRLFHCKMFCTLISRCKRDYKHFLADLQGEILRCLSSESNETVRAGLRACLEMAVAAVASSSTPKAKVVRPLSHFQSVDHFFDQTDSSIESAEVFLINPNHRIDAGALVALPPAGVDPAAVATATVASSTTLTIASNKLNSIRVPAKKKQLKESKSWYGRHGSPEKVPDERHEIGYKEFHPSVGRSLVNKLKTWRDSIMM